MIKAKGLTTSLMTLALLLAGGPVIAANPSPVKSAKKRLLFMCVANSARSQMAEGLAAKMFPEAEVHSSGSNPGHLNPYAVKVMKEIGIDISNHYSKSTEELPKEFIDHVDYVITLCSDEVCPTIVSKAKQLHWAMPDPATDKPLPEAEMLKRFRVARDTIKHRLEKFKIKL